MSNRVRLAIPNPRGDRISCKHCNPDGGWIISITCELFVTASRKQLPPVIDKLIWKQAHEVEKKP